MAIFKRGFIMFVGGASPSRSWYIILLVTQAAAAAVEISWITFGSNGTKHFHMTSINNILLLLIFHSYDNVRVRIFREGCLRRKMINIHHRHHSILSERSLPQVADNGATRVRLIIPWGWKNYFEIQTPLVTCQRLALPVVLIYQLLRSWW